MTPEEFDKALQRLWPKIHALLLEKNADYAGDDALKCWRKHGMAGLGVRFDDKLIRFDTFVASGGATADAWDEVLTDIVGYGLCALVWLLHGEDKLVLADEDAEPSLCVNCGDRRAGTKLHPDDDWCYECLCFRRWSSEAADAARHDEPLPDGDELRREYEERTGDGPLESEAEQTQEAAE